MPIDLDLVPGGNIDLIREDEDAPITAHVVPGNPSTARHVSHFATCPHAKRHRKPKVKDERTPYQKAADRRARAAYERMRDDRYRREGR